MGNECFNWNNTEKDLFVKKKSLHEQDNSHYKEKSDMTIPQQKNQYNLNNSYLDKNYDLLYSPTYTNRRNNNMETYNNKQPNLGKRSNSFKMIAHQEKRRISRFTREELDDEINDILRIRIPFFENNLLKTLSAFTFLSGNGPYHEGLMFFTTNKNFYIAQSYPITFIKVYDFYSGISEIISFNNLNSSSKKYNIPEAYMPQQRITLFNVLNIINNLPNSYNLINDNCQNFCNNILETLQKKYRIDIDDNPSKEKINFLRKQQKIKGYIIPHNKPYLYGSGRFNN